MLYYSTKRKNRNAFTLIELLVVIAIIALLVSILLPSLARAKSLARAVACMSQMKSWSSALAMYQSAYDGKFPYLKPNEAAGYLQGDYPWNQVLNPYVGDFDMKTDLYKVPAMKCPSSEEGNEVYLAPNYGGYNNGAVISGVPFVAPFVYGRLNPGCSFLPSVNIADIKHPSELFAMMDGTLSSSQDSLYPYTFVYTPQVPNWAFDTDKDGDGIPDTASSMGPGVVYNLARPDIHNNKANIVFCDGHVGVVDLKDWLDKDNSGWKDW